MNVIRSQRPVPWLICPAKEKSITITPHSPHTWYEGLLAKLRQDAVAAHSAFTAARAETDKLVHAQRGNAVPLGVLALIDAELGDKEKAIAEARTACDMLPSTKNALDGVWLMTNLARIYALTGQDQSPWSSWRY